MKRFLVLLVFVFVLSFVWADAHSYFDWLSGKSEVVLSKGYRSQSEIDLNSPTKYRPNSQVKYDPVEDAAKVTIPENKNEPGGLSMVKPGLDGDYRGTSVEINSGNVLFVWDHKWSNNFIRTITSARGLDGYKTYQIASENIGSDDRQIEIRNRFSLADPDEVAMVDHRSYAVSHPGDDQPMGRSGCPSNPDGDCQINAYAIEPDIWIRYWAYLDYDNSEYTFWVSDENNPPMKLFDKFPITFRGVNQFWFEYDTSQDEPTTGPEMNTWFRNFVVLHNIADVDSIVAQGDLSVSTNCTQDSNCTDNNLCTGIETCNLGTGVCESGTPVVTDDGVSCTIDSCDPGTGLVSNIVDDSLCVDSNGCTINERCDAVLGCLFDNSNGGCDDGDACTSGDTCSFGVCLGSQITSCTDSDGCCPSGCNSTNDDDCLGSVFSGGCGNVVGLFHFDEDSSVFLDSTGSGRDGSCVDCPAFSNVDCKFGNCTFFDGESLREIEVSGVPDAKAFSFWMKPTLGSSGHPFDWGAYQNSIRLSSDGSFDSFVSNNNRGSAPTGSVSSNQWQNFIVNTEGSETAYYVDGVEVFRVGSVASLGTYDLTIGQRETTNYEYDGLLDEFVVYNESLNSSQIASLAGAFEAISCESSSGGGSDCSSNGGVCRTNSCSSYVNCTDFSYSCSNGNCCQGNCSFFHEADLDTSGRIEFGEANAYIQLWLNGNRGIGELLAVVNLWRRS